jgi:putative ABC transport system substrate-binding protein
MRRRVIIITLFGATSLVPLVSLVPSAQQPAPVVGFLYAGPSEPNGDRVNCVPERYGGAGYDQGRNVAIEFRWAERDEQLPNWRLTWSGSVFR